MNTCIIKIFGAIALILLIPLTGAAMQTNPKILIKTSQGDLIVELNADKAPITVKNFLSYVDEKHYDDTIFHRVIKGFMIQGGGHLADMSEKSTKDPIKNEAANGLKNLRGTIAMARTADPHSASAQFFINHADNAFLDYKSSTPEGYGYCVFGMVVEGMEVVDVIANAKTMTKGGHRDVPRETIKIISIRRLENK